MARRRVAAVTGATGFLGRFIVRALADQGWQVRVLARRDPIDPLWRKLEPEVVPGDLADEAALRQLCRGAGTIVHAAGVVKARSAAAFHAVNAEGARRLAAAAQAVADGAPVLLVSSLAAREPQLSAYAASKRAGEAAATAVLGDRLTIVRPPAVYGPGDRETLPLFRAAAASPVLPLLHPSARIALVHVEDAARQIAALAGKDGPATVALCDGAPDGHSWSEIMSAAAKAVGRRPALVRLPDAAIRGLGLAGELHRWMGGVPMLTSGKARELLHRDWSLRPEETAHDLPPARFDLARGMAQTARWCRQAGWLAQDKEIATPS